MTHDKYSAPFSAEDAAFHREAMRQAHLKTLLPHFRRCTTDRERAAFGDLVNQEDVRELHRLAGLRDPGDIELQGSGT